MCLNYHGCCADSMLCLGCDVLIDRISVFAIVVFLKCIFVDVWMKKHCEICNEPVIINTHVYGTRVVFEHCHHHCNTHTLLKDTKLDPLAKFQLIVILMLSDKS